MMTADAVPAILDMLSAVEVPAWLDSGWGVDALIGAQTRVHEDLDVVIAAEHMETAAKALAAHGMHVLTDERPTRLVVGNERDIVDFHLVRFTLDGAGLQMLPDGREFRYPPEGFAGIGVVSGRSVPCLTAETQDLCHRGYDLDEKDYHDMALLRAHFRLTASP